jgi:drug/metabolite transporter (DMT)-like permease
MAYLIFATICLFWGGSFLMMKKAAVMFGPMTIAAGRVTTGSIALGALWILVFRRPWPLRRKDVPALLIVSLLSFALPFIVQPHLIDKYQDSAFFGLVVTLVPLLTLIVSVPMLGEYPTMRQIVGVLGGLGFLLLLADVGLDRQMTAGDLALTGTIPLCYALGNTYLKRRFAAIEPVAVAAAASLLAALVLLPLAGSTETPRPTTTTGAAVAVACLAVLGVINGGLAAGGFVYLIQSRGPLFASMVTYIVPAGALAWGWLDNETITLRQILALGGILVMVALVQSSSGRRMRPTDDAMKKPGHADPAQV